MKITLLSEESVGSQLMVFFYLAHLYMLLGENRPKPIDLYIAFLSLTQLMLLKTMGLITSLGEMGF